MELDLGPDDVKLWLSRAAVEALASRLTHLARVTMNSQLAELATEWVTMASTMAYLLKHQTETDTLGSWEFAIRHQVPLRTVQRHCALGKLPAMKNEAGNWRIKVAA